MHGFQLWVNLPRARKMDEPRYQEFAPEEVPSYSLADGSQVTVIAGRSHGVQGAAQAPLYRGPLRGRASAPGPPSRTRFRPSTTRWSTSTRARSRSGPSGSGPPTWPYSETSRTADGVEAKAVDGDARWLLIAGRPLREPIVAYGPFVMSSRAEIEQAFADYRSGRLTR